MYVTAYGFTQINQRNLWSILDWTSQNPLQMMFSSENNLREQPRRYKLTVLYKYYLQSSKSYITALSSAHKVTSLTPQSNSTYQSH